MIDMIKEWPHQIQFILVLMIMATLVWFIASLMKFLIVMIHGYPKSCRVKHTVGNVSEEVEKKNFTETMADREL